MNSRLDSLQAAVLIEKLRIFAEEVEIRQAVAARYDAGFAGIADRVIPPHVLDGAVSAWALYTVRIPGGKRDGVQQALSAQGIPSVVYYPRALHEQPAYETYPRASAAGLPVAEGHCAEVLSLPMHPYLDEEVQNIVIEAVRAEI